MKKKTVSQLLDYVEDALARVMRSAQNLLDELVEEGIEAEDADDDADE